MTDPRERILESALERMFEEERSGEAAERILIAWRRGVTGTGLKDLDIDLDEPESPDAVQGLNGVNGHGAAGATVESESRSQPAGSWGLRAAAALLLVGGAVVVWSSRESLPSGPHWIAERRVALVDGAGETRRTRIVESGQRVVVDGGDPVAFTWAGGGESGPLETPRRIVASGQTTFEWHPEELLLLSGELQVDAPGDPLNLNLRTARVAIPTGTSVVARIQNRGEGEGLDAEVDTLGLVVRSGSAAMEYGEFSPVLVTGDECTLPGDPEQWWRETGQPMAMLCGDLPRLGFAIPSVNPDAWLEEHVRFDQVAGKIAALLDRDPLTWEVLERRFADGRGEERDDYPARFVSFLAWEQSDRALDLARTMWIESPQSFSEEHLVAFASRGAFEFERELRAMLEGGEADMEFGLMAAAYFARKGDDVGRPLLTRLAELRRWEGKYGVVGGWVQTLLACGALRWLGEPGPWDGLQDRLNEFIPGAMEEVSLSYAGVIVAFADYFATEGESVLTRVPMDLYLALHYTGMRSRLDSPGKVRDMVAELAGRW